MLNLDVSSFYVDDIPIGLNCKNMQLEARYKGTDTW